MSFGGEARRIRTPKLNLAQAAAAKAGPLHQALSQMGYPGLRKVQQIPVENILCERDILVVAPTSAGKCFGKGTPIMLSSGKVVPVESIQPGDELMGPDGEARKVLSTCTGSEELYLVQQQRGIDYVVNESHILSLRITGMKEGDRTRCGGQLFSSYDLANVAVKDYLAAPKTFRHVAKGWKSPCIETFKHGLGAPDEELPPYMLGLWFGDGASDAFKITTADAEVVSSVCQYAADIGHLVTVDASGDRCPSYSVVSPEGKRAGAGNEINTPKRILRALGCLKHKDAGIPAVYRLANYYDRWQLLAGLLDADGSLIRDSGYDFISKYERLAEDCAQVARSLGLHATVTPCEKTCTNTGTVGDYWRVYISGDVFRIPVRVPRKKALPVNMRTNPLLTGIKLVPQGQGRYYGFTVDGPDRLFLLGDHTVAHNSAMFAIPTLALGWKTLVFSPLVALMRDQVIEFTRRGIAADFVNSLQTSEANAQALINWAQGRTQILYVAPERLPRDDFRAAMAQTPPDMVTVDEVHCLSQWALNFRHEYCMIGDFIAEFDPRCVSAYTATCTEEIEDDACRVLGLPKTCTLWQYYRRDNLHLTSRFLESDYDIVRDIESANGKAIVYFSTIRRLEEFTPWLEEKLGIPIGIYHGKLPVDVKTHLQDAFKDGEIEVMCATNAFGLGVNIEDVRMVIHHDPPGTPEALSQEVGRAGRDEKDADCITYYHTKGWQTQEGFVEGNNPDATVVRAVYDTMARLGHDGALIKKTGNEIADMAGVSRFGIQAVMQLLAGCNVVRTVDSPDRLAQIAFRGSSDGDLFRKYAAQIRKGGLETNSSFLEINLDWLRQQLGVTEGAVTSNLRKWDTEGLIDYRPPFRGKPKVVCGDLSRVNFDLLARKRTLAWDKLAITKEYMEIPDSGKHEFFEDYFERRRPPAEDS